MSTCFLLLYVVMFKTANGYKGNIKRALALLAVAALALGALSCRSPGSKKSEIAQSNYQLGMSHLVTGDTQSAFVKFHEALLLKSNHKEAMNGLGYVYLSRNDYKKAEESFRSATKVDKEYSEAYNNLCFALYSQGMYKDAIESCSHALDNPVYPSPEKAFYNTGRSYHKMGRYKDAIGAFEEALKRHPNFFQGLYAQALSYNSDRQYGKAAEAMNLAVGLDPRFKGDKHLAESKFRELKEKGIIAPDEVSQFLEILHY